jgi:hypothetical protein
LLDAGWFKVWKFKVLKFGKVEKFRGLKVQGSDKCPSRKPPVIPKEERLRELPSINLPFRQKLIQSIIAGDSRLPDGQV